MDDKHLGAELAAGGNDTGSRPTEAARDIHDAINEFLRVRALTAGLKYVQPRDVDDFDRAIARLRRAVAALTLSQAT